jgi:NTE family protein
MTNDYHFIVLDLPSRIEQPAFCLLNQSDVVHILSGLRPQELKKTRSLIERLKKECFAQNEKIRLIVNQAVFPPAAAKQALKSLQDEVFATLPFLSKRNSDRVVLDAPESEYAKAIRRISRKEGDCQVGLALGVGAAYGFCHIGVLKVIEDFKIPIDVISGSSMGAVIASLWATGRSSDEILEITSEFKEPKFIWELLDFTFPFLGFIKGNKLYRLLNKWLRNKTFFDVNIPLKIVASDVKRKERRVIDKGLLVDALMATCSMPGVFNPFIFKEEMLFDGGIMSPLPTEPLFEMGIKKIIAVNVTPSKEDIMKHLEQAKSRGAVETPKAAEKKRMFDLRQYVQRKLKTNILDIIFSSVEILQSEVAKKEGQLADVVLHPDTAGMHWMEFEKAEEFAKRGEEEMKRHLHKIWMLINE